MTKKPESEEVICTFQLIRSGGNLVLQLEEKPGAFREKLWRSHWEQGKHSFERYRQLRMRMLRQHKEIERLRALLPKGDDNAD